MKTIRITRVYAILMVVIVIISVFVFTSLKKTVDNLAVLRQDIESYTTIRDAFDDMKEASAYLTDQSRYFVVTGDKEYLCQYMNEVRVQQRRDKALETIMNGTEANELWTAIGTASNMSNKLMLTELYAMTLAAEGYGLDISDIDLSEYGIVISPQDAALPPKEKIDRAIDMLFDDYYASMQSTIEGGVYDGLDGLVESMRDAEETHTASVERLLMRQTCLTMALVACLLFFMVLTVLVLLAPIKRSTNLIRADQKMPRMRATELAYMAGAYNAMYDIKTAHLSQLSYDVSHDELTGVFNRKLFEEKRLELAEDDLTLVLIDVDHFKSINDTYGHDVGDSILKEVAAAISSGFRSSDYVCRIGGDEFAVLLPNMRREGRSILEMKIERIRGALRIMEDLPAVTLSIGVAFSDGCAAEELFRRADKALYQSKDKGRDHVSFYETVMDTAPDTRDPDHSEGAQNAEKS